MSLDKCWPQSGLQFLFLENVCVLEVAVGLTHFRSLPAPGPGLWKQDPGRGDGIVAGLLSLEW